MMIGGTIERGGYGWVVTVDALGAYGNATTRAAACTMAASAVTGLVGYRRPLAGFEARVIDAGDGVVYVTSNDPVRLIGLLLWSERSRYWLTVADVTKRLGAKSTTSYAAYEQGKLEPSIGKLGQLLAAVAPELALAVVARPRDERTKRRAARPRTRAGAPGAVRARAAKRLSRA